MFCPNCGHDNLDNAAHCAACGTSLTTGAVPPPPPPGWGAAPPPLDYATGHREPKPDNYLVWAILVTLCCCIPGGIVSIVYATQVDSKYNAGDYAGAQQASDSAKQWAIISAVVGFVVGGLSVVAELGNSGSF